MMKYIKSVQPRQHGPERLVFCEPIIIHVLGNLKDTIFNQTLHASKIKKDYFITNYKVFLSKDIKHAHSLIGIFHTEPHLPVA